MGATVFFQYFKASLQDAKLNILNTQGSGSQARLHPGLAYRGPAGNHPVGVNTQRGSTNLVEQISLSRPVKELRPEQGSGKWLVLKGELE